MLRLLKDYFLFFSRMLLFIDFELIFLAFNFVPEVDFEEKPPRFVM
jgi:hypothetical protein